MKESMNFIFTSKLDYTTGKCTHSYNFLDVAKEGVLSDSYLRFQRESRRLDILIAYTSLVTY